MRLCRCAALREETLVDAGLTDPLTPTLLRRFCSQGEYIVKQFPGQPFEYTIVEDIGAPDAFDEAVKGVEGVAHTASPFHLKADDPQELIRPAVNGTVGVLKSLTKNNPEVKRVVMCVPALPASWAPLALTVRPGG